MQPKFSVDEKVLCYHGPLLYEAKCLKMKKEGGNYSYFVHYQGWNKNWDEWVTESRMLKQVAENYEKQKKLLASHIAQTKANRKQKKETNSKKNNKGGSDSNSNSRASTPVGERVAPPKSGSNKRNNLDDVEERSTSSRDDDVPPAKEVQSLSRSKKRKEEPPNEDSPGIAFAEETGAPEPKLTVDLPTDLKYLLCYDWDQVVNQKKLFIIPAKVSVSNIIDQYVAHLSSQESNIVKKSTAAEVIRGLGEYFNTSIGSQLLYNIEKLQYKEDCLRKDALLPSQIYGSAHLLRLMVKIGNYLSAAAYTESEFKMLEDHLEDFLAYLDMNKAMFFKNKNYAPAGADYISRSQSAKP